MAGGSESPGTIPSTVVLPCCRTVITDDESVGSHSAGMLLSTPRAFLCTNLMPPGFIIMTNYNDLPCPMPPSKNLAPPKCVSLTEVHELVTCGLQVHWSYFLLLLRLPLLASPVSEPLEGASPLLLCQRLP